jgi:cytochrome c oxidase cbb3-type subunit 3
MANEEKKDELLDHDADGIQEFDNNLPKWWLYGFYLTIVFAIAYMMYYHVSQDGQVSKTEYENEIAEASLLTANLPKSASKTLIALTDKASLDAGKVIFEGTNNLCSTCHKEDMGGLVGPNLTDEYWIHGCSIQEIAQSITTGFPEKGMLPYGSNNKLTDEQLLQVASYVISKKGSNPPDAKPIEPDREIVCAPSQKTTATK